MISCWRKCKEIERKSIGAKTEQKQGKNRGLRDFAATARLALRCETVSQPKRSRCGINVSLRKRSSFAKPISQLNWLFCENFHSCEIDFGTRVPLHSTGAPILQLRNGCEATKRENSQFRRVFRSCETNFGTRVPFRNTVTPISQMQNGLRKSFFFCKNSILLRNRPSSVKLKMTFNISLFFINTGHLSCERVSERGNAIATVCSLPYLSPTTREPPVIPSGHHFQPNFVSPI